MRGGVEMNEGRVCRYCYYSGPRIRWWMVRKGVEVGRGLRALIICWMGRLEGFE